VTQVDSVLTVCVSCYSPASMLVTLPRCVALAGLGFFLSLAACGGSSSETPPPLQPLPVNVHYDRSSTTLPGELGMPAPEPTDAGAPKTEPPAAETIGTAAPAASAPQLK
jgi:hypothetical protein